MDKPSRNIDFKIQRIVIGKNNDTVDMQPDVTILVATRDRPLPLKRLLESLYRQKVNRPFEVIIVEDIHGKGPSTARQNGLEVSCGEIIVTVDDDLIMHPQAVEAARKFIGSGGKAAAGAVKLAGPGLMMDLMRIRDDIHRGFIEGRTVFIPTELAVYHKQALIKAGGFPLNFPFACEDMALSDALSEKGVELQTLHSMRGWHIPDLNIYSTLKRYFRYGSGHRLYWKNHGSRRQNRPIKVMRNYLIGAVKAFEEGISMNNSLESDSLMKPLSDIIRGVTFAILDIMIRFSFHAGALAGRFD